MLLIFGTRPQERIVASGSAVCRFCNVQALQRTIERSNRFTLFFVPLFRFSKSRVSQCLNCGAETPSLRRRGHGVAGSQLSALSSPPRSPGTRVETTN